MFRRLAARWAARRARAASHGPVSPICQSIRPHGIRYRLLDFLAVRRFGSIVLIPRTERVRCKLSASPGEMLDLHGRDVAVLRKSLSRGPARRASRRAAHRQTVPHPASPEPEPRTRPASNTEPPPPMSRHARDWSRNRNRTGFPKPPATALHAKAQGVGIRPLTPHSRVRNPSPRGIGIRHHVPKTDKSRIRPLPTKTDPSTYRIPTPHVSDSDPLRYRIPTPRTVVNRR